MPFFDNFTKKVGDAAKSAVKKSEDLMETTKISMSIKSEEDKIKAICGELGKIVYSKYTSGEILDDQLVSGCQQIKEIEGNIADLKEKIAQIKNAQSQASQPQYGAPQGMQQSQTQYTPQYNQAPPAAQPQYSAPTQPVQPQAVPQYIPTSGPAAPQFTKQSGQEAPTQPADQAQDNVCPACGTVAMPGGKFCPSCGARLQ